MKFGAEQSNRVSSCWSWWSDGLGGVTYIANMRQQLAITLQCLLS